MLEKYFYCGYWAVIEPLRKIACQTLVPYFSQQCCELCFKNIKWFFSFRFKWDPIHYIHICNHHRKTLHWFFKYIWLEQIWISFEYDCQATTAWIYVYCQLSRQHLIYVDRALNHRPTSFHFGKIVEIRSKYDRSFNKG